MSWRCLFGSHAWSQSRELTGEERMGTPAWSGGDTPTRKCERCGRVERFRPGGCGTFEDSLFFGGTQTRPYVEFGRWRREKP